MPKSVEIAIEVENLLNFWVLKGQTLVWLPY